MVSSLVLFFKPRKISNNFVNATWKDDKYEPNFVKLPCSYAVVEANGGGQVAWIIHQCYIKAEKVSYEAREMY